MPPWIEHDQLIAFEQVPTAQRRDLEGDEMALKYRQAWVEGKRYPLIQFPSGTEHEIRQGRGEHEVPHIHIFGSLELPYQSSRDAAYDFLISEAQEQGLILS